jgi:hypothetical protein
MNKIYSRYCDNYIFAIFDDVQHKNSQPESVDKLFWMGFSLSRDVIWVGYITQSCKSDVKWKYCYSYLKLKALNKNYDLWLVLLYKAVVFKINISPFPLKYHVSFVS